MSIDVSIVVPVYNNAATLPELIDRLVAVLEGAALSFEIIAVDDGSVDLSRALLDERAARDPHLRVYSLARNFGGQAARCAGFELVRGARTVCIDADLENSPEDIPTLLGALDRGHDLACAVRVARGDAWSSRQVPSAVFNWYARRRLGTPIRDLWCGMRAMDSRIVADLASEGEWRRLLTPLFLARARSAVEVPVRHEAATDGSSYSLFALAGVAADFVVGTAKHPFLISLLIAGGAAVASLLLLICAMAANNVVLTLASLVLTTTSLLGVLVSAVGVYVQRGYELAQAQPFFRLRDEDRARATAQD